MGTFRMEQATTDVALDKIAALANEIWHEHFVPIIGLDRSTIWSESFSPTLP